MKQQTTPRILFSERLSNGIVVHFEDVSVFFSAQSLYEQRHGMSNLIFDEDMPIDPQNSHNGNPASPTSRNDAQNEAIPPNNLPKAR